MESKDQPVRDDTSADKSNPSHSQVLEALGGTASDRGKQDDTPDPTDSATGQVVTNPAAAPPIQQANTDDAGNEEEEDLEDYSYWLTACVLFGSVAIGVGVYLCMRAQPENNHSDSPSDPAVINGDATPTLR